MKKYLLLGILFILISLPSIAFADNIQTGNSTVENNVTSTVNGGNCATHIEITVNGQKEVADSNNCGTTNINKTVNGSSQTVTNSPSETLTPSISPAITISASITSTPTPVILDKNKLHAPSLIAVVISNLQDFFNHVFHML